MRFDHHSPWHWFAVALVGGLALFTFTHAWGQSTNATAVFQGRPAMAGAQGGLGAQAGMAQGGIGVQGTDASQPQLNLRRPGGLDAAPAAFATGAPAVAPVAARSDVTLVPKRDDVGKQVRSPTRTVKKAARRTLQRSRTGVGGIDAIGATPR